MDEPGRESRYSTTSSPAIHTARGIITSAENILPDPSTILITVTATAPATTTVALSECGPSTVYETTTVTFNTTRPLNPSQETSTRIETITLEPITILQPTTILKTTTVTSAVMERETSRYPYFDEEEELNHIVRPNRDIGNAREYCKQCGQVHCCKIHV